MFHQALLLFNLNYEHKAENVLILSKMQIDFDNQI